MYEHRNEPLISRGAFLRRMINHGGVAALLIGISLGLGVAGYHFFESLPWIDSLVNASMILGGMGPVDPLHTVAGKLFASFYALYSGLIFLVVVGVVFAPVLHRALHHFHLEATGNDGEDPATEN